jgi:hypothetical protein
MLALAWRSDNKHCNIYIYIYVLTAEPCWQHSSASKAGSGSPACWQEIRRSMPAADRGTSCLSVFHFVPCDTLKHTNIGMYWRFNLQVVKAAQQVTIPSHTHNHYLLH